LDRLTTVVLKDSKRFDAASVQAPAAEQIEPRLGRNLKARTAHRLVLGQLAKVRELCDWIDGRPGRAETRVAASSRPRLAKKP
jgi:hypothetical protein